MPTDSFAERFSKEMAGNVSTADGQMSSRFIISGSEVHLETTTWKI